MPLEDISCLLRCLLLVLIVCGRLTKPSPLVGVRRSLLIVVAAAAMRESPFATSRATVEGASEPKLLLAAVRSRSESLLLSW